jgi:hypothetical protein
MISWPNDVPNPIHYHTAEAAHSGVTTGRRRGYKFIYPSGTLPHNHPNPNVTPNSIIPTSTTPEPKSIRQWQHSVYRNQNWAPTIQSFKCIHNLTTARYVFFKRKQLWHCASRAYFCKVQRADLTCDVTSIRLRCFDTWPISDEYSNFAPVTWHVSLPWVQVNLFQKHLFFHQLTHNMTKDCSLIYEFSTWKF